MDQPEVAMMLLQARAGPSLCSGGPQPRECDAVSRWVLIDAEETLHLLRRRPDGVGTGFTAACAACHSLCPAPAVDGQTR